MRRKLLSFLLAATMVTGCIGLTGCGNKDAADAGSAAQSSDAGSENAGEDAVANLIKSTKDTVKLTVWASEEDQDLTKSLLDKFQKEYSDVKFNIQLGKESESKTKDDILKDVDAAPDVFAFADDQINELVKAGALQEVVADYTYDVKSENVAGSIEAATVDDKLYAYPMTADNGYFMFYDSSVFSEDDVKTLDGMVAAAKKAGKKIAIEASNAWYFYSFFKGAGYDLSLNEDGSNTCDWNGDGATDVAQAIIDLYKSGIVVNLNDAATVTGIKDGTVAAAVNGTWNAKAASKAWKKNYSACKLPTFTVAGKQVQMASFSGCKLVGVNPRSKFVGWSMLLAEYLTNYDAQVERFNQRELGPSNIKASESDEVQSNKAIAALASQAEFAAPQRVGNNYWSPVETLGKKLADGNLKGTDLQKLLDNAVAGITASVEDSAK